MRKYQLLIAAILLLNAHAVWANDFGSSAARILKQAVGARTFAVGEAYCAMADDVQVLHYNPAGLAVIPSAEISLMYIHSILDIYYGYAGYAQPAGPGVIAGSILTLQGGDIEINNADGTSDTFKAQQDYVFTVGYALDITQFVPGLLLGIAGKAITSTLLEEYSAQAFAGDVGVIYKSPVKGLSFGVAAQNIGTQLTYLEYGDPLPFTSRIGSAYGMELGEGHYLIGAIEMVNTKNVHLGLEYELGGIFFARGGYKQGYDLDNVTFGAGFKINIIQLDYALGLKGDLGMNHYISLTVITGK
ncbi:PorV/PorQ family protein [candidate division FCPU426 bacterium]|nr:PorV/PorQ family protein [candidate division FCPU426 bacterium]